MSTSGRMDANMDQLKEQEEPATNREEQDRVKLLSTFPEEVWSMVLKKIEEPEDLHGLWNSSPFFRTRISQNPSQFLFPQVWPLVRQHFERAVESSRVNSQEEEEVPTEQTNCNVPIPIEKQMLNLRKVCRTWSTGLDNYYEGSRNQLDKTQEDGKSSAGPWMTVNNLKNLQLLQKFSDHFEESHENRNPFVGRSVALHSNHWSTAHETNLLWSVLEKYGHHIWYCKISLVVTQLPILDVYNRLQRMLSLLPNVKSLQIDFGMLAWQMFVLGPRGPTARMPTFSKLTHLSLTSSPDLVTREIIMANRLTLQSLKIDQGIMMNLNRSYEVAMPNLKQVKWKVYTEQNLVELKNSEVHWPVEELQLEFEQGVAVQLSRIFKLLEDKWANTLTTLSLEICKPREEETLKLLQMESLTLELGLPHLKSFHLKLCSAWALSLDFLVGVKDSLETLKVEWCQDEQMLMLFPEEKKVGFWGNQERLLESDIWSWFPKLERIFTTKTIREKTTLRMMNRYIVLRESQVTGAFFRGQRGQID